MNYILFEAAKIANIIKCSNFKTNQNISSKRDVWAVFEFAHENTMETYSITNDGHVYYSVQTKNKFFIIKNMLISNDYRKWIKAYHSSNLYISLLNNLYKLVEVCTEIIYKELDTAFNM